MNMVARPPEREDELNVRQARSDDQPAIESLLDAAFGKDRHQRTAYRVRQGTHPIDSLSHVVEQDGEIIASLQCWPVALFDGTNAVPLVMLGPVAVKPLLQRSGIGQMLMLHVLAIADTQGAPPIMLIGDPEYYGRFGFVANWTGEWTLPGPFEQHRLLLRGGGPALAHAGEIGPRPQLSVPSPA